MTKFLWFQTNNITLGAHKKLNYPIKETQQHQNYFDRI